ncbi:aminopeptidase P family protein [Olivibacter domesticus]|uniref:Xaa-Pro aminopeptidase n=1 Tax=Olivibacter domesticus TaxID=407022 RepID=A0A1H7TMC2_OLID1|nr:aminopeptidase P family protein [Olivibacter domesticus]SEL86032.1 Xaa-Pro aminopeptidase [Olivibacter domesticus]
MFHSSTYIDRRKQLKTTISKGILLFIGNNESPMNYADNAFPFRQDSSFLYYFGIQEPKLAAVIDLDENKDILFGDELTIDEIVWMGRQETLQEKCRKVGIEDIQPSSQLAPYLQKALRQQRVIHFLPPYQSENKLKLIDLLGLSLKELASQASAPFIQAVVAQRSVKSQEEVTQIETAVNTSVDMHLLAMRLAKAGTTELQVANAIQEMAQNAGGRLAYPTILSVHGEILHNHKHLNTLRDGQLVLNDSGAETAMGYAGDLTRTFPVGKTFTNKQKEIYNIVLEALQQSSALLAPSVRYLDVHFKACSTLVEGLKSIGLMKGNTEEAVALGAHTLFFQCGTGHMMGLDVHDMEDLGEQYVGYTETLKKDTTTFGLKSLRLGKELAAGYVLTVEPGIYFIPELFSRWKAENKLKDFINYNEVEKYLSFGGVRIEDNYLVTDTGYKKLGKELAKTIEEVEEIRKDI